jgi:NADPH:quinone reductase-like Zn-dependent oxidoreductase
MGEARGFWVAAPGRGEIRAESLPQRRSGEVLVRARVSAISRGSEGLVFRGEVPESEYRRMRCPFQQGEFPAPVKYGYASVGVIEDGPAERIGERVFCLHPHQDRYIVPAEAALPVPAEVPDRRAALAANLETAINGVWDGAPGPGDRVAVIGAGVVGGFIAALGVRISATEVELIDIDPGRAALAARIGCGFARPETAAGDADLVFHASGDPAGLALALRLAGTEATVVEMSWYGTRAASLPLGEAFHSRRLTIRSSQVGSVPPGRAPRWSRRRRLALALSLLRDPMFDAFLSGDTPFADLPELLPRLAQPGSGALCNTVHYD